MKPNQIQVLATAVPGDAHQIVDALEPRRSREIVSHILDVDGRDRIDDDVPVVHPVAAADLDARAQPHPNGATNASAPDPFAKTFREQHWWPRSYIKKRGARFRGRRVLSTNRLVVQFR